MHSVLIGLTMNYDYRKKRCWLPEAYCRCITAAGGIPVLLPDLPIPAALSLYSRLSGLVLTGGGDVSPFFYAEEPRPGLGEVDPQRDEWEITLAGEALRRGLPLLGICRGMQMINVAVGGTLCQDLSGESLLQHMQKAPSRFPSHTVKILPGSRLASLLGEITLPVNSFHHQSIAALAPSLAVAAVAPDGVIEALECPSHPFALGVQWHPESLAHTASALLFRALVQAAEEIPK